MNQENKLLLGKLKAKRAEFQHEINKLDTEINCIKNSCKHENAEQKDWYDSEEGYNKRFYHCLDCDKMWNEYLD